MKQIQNVGCFDGQMLHTFFGSKYDPLCIMDGKWNLGDQKRFWGCCTQLLFGGGNDARQTQQITLFYEETFGVVAIAGLIL